MRLLDILHPDCVQVCLEATGKQEAIYELIDLLAATEHIGSVESLRDAVWKREITRTTGIGHGIAIPHGKVAGCSRLCMALAKAAVPIEFGSIDNQPVDLIFLLASPIDQTGPHIQALAQISHLLIDEGFRAVLRQASTPKILYDTIADQESKTVG